MSSTLKNEVLVVSNGDLGLAIAAALQNEGYNVALLRLHPHPLGILSTTRSVTGPTIRYLYCDLTDPVALAQWAERYFSAGDALLGIIHALEASDSINESEEVLQCQSLKNTVVHLAPYVRRQGFFIEVAFELPCTKPRAETIRAAQAAAFTDLVRHALTQQQGVSSLTSGPNIIPHILDYIKAHQSRKNQ